MEKGVIKDQFDKGEDEIPLERNPECEDQIRKGMQSLASHRMVWLRAAGRRPQENTKKRDDYEKPFKILSSGFSNLDLFDSDLQPSACGLQSEASLWVASVKVP